MTANDFTSAEVLLTTTTLIMAGTSSPWVALRPCSGLIWLIFPRCDEN